LQIFLADGSKRDFSPGATLSDVAQSISPNVSKSAVAGKQNGKLVDLSTALNPEDKIEIILGSSPEGLEVLRHSTAHLLAMAVQKLYPHVQITIGPVVGEMFYYDIFSPEHKISSHNFEKIEAYMMSLVQENLPFSRQVVSREEALLIFADIKEIFKLEIIESIPESEDISIYHIGDQWFDVCRGPHVPSTSHLKAFKLLSVAGAFWRGDKNNPQLTRIYGTAWSSEKELKNYLFQKEEALKRDHTVVGKKLELFTFYPDTALGMPFFLPKGALFYRLLHDYILQKMIQHGFQEVMTPQLMNVDLWKSSGHYDCYHENMYFSEVDETQYALKPMNCPGHVKVFNASPKSYRDLPVRYAELAFLHRYELHGAVHGLTRVRRFATDDGHIFCTHDQYPQEIESALMFLKEVYSELGFQDFSCGLSTRPPKFIGDLETWNIAESSLESSLKRLDLPYTINVGDGAFYGPKIDFTLKDSLGRFHQCGTIQLDFYMPQRLGATYISPENHPTHPVMIHRAILGSLERFMGLYIEHCDGHFPFWLCPVQLDIITINDDLIPYAEEVSLFFQKENIRIEKSFGSHTLNSKIRHAQVLKTPWMLILGKKEQESQTVTLRHWKGDQHPGLSWEAALARLQNS
jgi:threonyl-tRNA synthetase